MNPGAPSRPKAGASRRLAEGYEALRQQVFDRGANRGWGLSLFLARGMAAWASAWAGSAEKPQEHSPERMQPLSEPRAVLPKRSEDLVGVLAAMVCALQREAAA